jgi:sarcosine oxidase subunit beta
VDMRAHARATPLPASASVAIIGGGVIGTSIAFHLAEAGVRDVVLIERHELGSGSTSKAAGGVRAQFTDALNVKLSARGIEAYARFTTRPGQEIDFRRDGYLFLLSRPDDVAMFERGIALQNSLGVASRMIDPAEARRRCPLIETDGLLAAAFCADDGRCTPESAVLGYASGARRLGATLVTRCEVVGIEMTGDNITTVVTSRGRITVPVVICAAGAWSAAVGAMAGVDLPVTPYRRQIVVTEPVAVLGRLPLTIDFTSGCYLHREGRGLLVGFADPDEEPGFRFQPPGPLPPSIAQAMAQRMPHVLDLGITGGWSGVYEITPDHNALVGEASDRFLYATGFSGHGFLQAPSVGEIVRDLFLRRAPFVDVSPLDAGRFARGLVRPEANFV